MKKTAFLTLTAVALMSTAFAQKVSFKIKGSDTCLPLIQKESEVYQKNNANTSITVVGGGSGVGFAALIEGTTDMAMASRKIKMDESEKLKNANKPYTETIFAKDAISVIVNPGNKVSQLTREQLAGIFTGVTTNWNQVGGDNMPIVVYSRESSSGTFEFFKESVLKGKNYASSVLLMPATGAIVQSVSQTKGAIGYVGLAYVDKSVKALKVSYDQGKTYVVPSIANAKNNSYPITRPLYVYFLNTSEKTVQPFVNFLLSPAGQKIELTEGYVPLK